MVALIEANEAAPKKRNQVQKARHSIGNFKLTHYQIFFSEMQTRFFDLPGGFQVDAFSFRTSPPAGRPVSLRARPLDRAVVRATDAG